MFAFTLESLVLRGVVRKGELAVSRLGFGVKAEPCAPGNPHPVRPSTTGKRRSDPTQAMPDVGYPIKSIRSGAGRSRRLAGTPLRGEVATATLWWRNQGGLARAAAANVRGLSLSFVASAGEVSRTFATLPPTRTGPQDRSR